MTITTEELARIRAIAEADKNGADGKAWDEAITPDTVIALCDRIEEQQDALRLLDMELSAVRNALEATELEAYLLEQSNLWIAAVAFNGTASDYGSLYGLVKAAREAVGWKMKPNDTDKKVMPEPSNLGAAHADFTIRLLDALDEAEADQERLEREADWLAHGYTNAVDLLGMCPRNVDMSKCQDSSCMECMRESARKAVEEGR